jgi:quercetin dioxygenase-like cupin family protein
MSFVNLSDLSEKQLAPGYMARIVHADHLTVSHVKVEAGAPLPQHAHPHEQISILVEGEFEMTVAGETRTIKAGSDAIIPSNAVHSGKAITDCYIIDVFYPVREDFKSK